MMRALMSLLATALICVTAPGARAFDYALAPQKITDDIYVLTGQTDHFNRSNGGNIVNTAIITTPAGSIVIDPGPTHSYAEQLIEQAKRLGHGSVLRAYVTHAHPDHFLGTQAFIEAGIPVYALEATRRQISEDGAALVDNLSRLIGSALSGTRSAVPDHRAEAGTIDIGGRTLRLMAGAGHTSADLVIVDTASQTVFAGDLLFFERTPTTPHADIRRWLDQLDVLATLDANIWVPGHGAVVSDARALRQTRAYLVWLQTTLQSAAEQGQDLAELLDHPPPDIGPLAVFNAEFARSLAHLFPAFEARALKPVAP